MNFLKLPEKTLTKHLWRSDILWATILFSPKFFRNIPLLFDISILMKSQYWPRNRIEALTAIRLTEVVKMAVQIPFWHEIFQKKNINLMTFSLSDLHQLPIISKKDLSGREWGEITNASLFPHSFQDCTSGSTGHPLRFVVDKGYALRMYALCERMFRIAGGGARLPVISMRARERIGFAFRGSEFFYLSGFNSMRYRITALKELTSSHKERSILYGFVSSLLELARLVKERNIHLHLTSVICAGETLHRSGRQMLQATLGIDVFSCYSTRELGWIAFECPHHNLHINEESVYVEILDKDNGACPPGVEGRVVVTSFENRVMPFIRYFTGDIGSFNDVTCACGRTLKTITIRGREMEIITTKNVSTSLLELSSCFDNHFTAVRQYQIIQTSPMTFVIKVVPGPEFEAKKKDIEYVLRQFLHPDTCVEWALVDEIPAATSGKAICFVNMTL